MAMRSTGRPPSAAGSIGEPGLSRGPFDPRAILTSIGEVVYDWNIGTDAITWGVNAGEVLGLKDLSTVVSGRDFAQVVEPDSGQTRHDVIFGSGDCDQGTGVAYRTRYTLRLADEQPVTVEDSGRWFADADGQPAFAHGVLRIDRAESAAAVPSARDRLHFLDQIKGDVVETGRSKRALTLMVVAIEELGRLNDDLGYEGADDLIQEVARRIRSVMRRRDRLVRYAGNRFAAALTACPSPEAALAARRIAQAVEGSPIATGQGPIVVRLRIGAATAPDHAADASGLLRRAEEALAAAKRGYGQPFALYDPSHAREAARRARMPSGLDVVEALNDRRIGFARQPVVEAGSREVAFSEALVRLRDTDGRAHAASDILSGVERAGLVHLVDTRMLELTADYLAAHPGERLSINVSPLTLEHADWLRILAAHLGARPGIASRLIVEITETAAVRDPQATRARLDAMKALGVAIAIDDFGAGHTSFKHLRSFPIDILKIDGAFVQNLARSTDDRFFVRTLVDLAHHLGIATVAEWVEDEATARMLAEWGIDYLQGDHCGPPVLEAPAPALPMSASA